MMHGIAGDSQYFAVPRGNRHTLMSAASPRQTMRGVLAALALAVVLSLVLLALRSHLSTANLALIYLLPVLTGATLGGLLPGVLAAVLCTLTFDLLFVQPYGALNVASGQDLLTLGLYLGIGALAAELAARARARAEEAARQAATNALLYDLTSVFLAGDLEAVLKELVERLSVVFALRSCDILLPDTHGALRSGAHWGPDLVIANAEDRRQLDAVAAWAYSKGETVGLSLDRPKPRGPRIWKSRTSGSGSRETVLFLPLRSGQVQAGIHATGVLALARPIDVPLSDEETRLLTTFATQAAIAVDRARLAEESAQAAVLRESDRAKSALLSNVSHDLRTPLTTIRGAAESLLAPDLKLDATTCQELLSSIRDEAERLGSLVGNLLSLSRLEAGALQPERHLYHLSEIVGRVLARMAPQMPDHIVQARLAPDVPPVLVDYALFEQVLVNLLENAAKYAPRGTAITIALRCEGDQALLSVADEGPGIPSEARDRVFERFYRLTDSTTRRVPGTGLGLAICQAIVAAHGGRIWIAEQAEQGATVAIALPIPVETALVAVGEL